MKVQSLVQKLWPYIIQESIYVEHKVPFLFSSFYKSGVLLEKRRAGRALTLSMESFSGSELGEAFDLEFALSWGALPLVYE
jgi:hypothetical protein